MAVLYTPHFMQFFDDNGDPLANGKLYTYSPGTNTPKDTYTTSAGTVANANPLILDANGRTVLFLDGAYRFRLETSTGVLVEETDSILAFTTSSIDINSILPSQTGNSGEFLTTGGEASSWSPITSNSIVFGAPVSVNTLTAVDFTGIPSTANQIVISFEDVRNTLTDSIVIQLGDSGGIETAGSDTNNNVLSTGSVATGSNTGDGIVRINNSGLSANGSFIISKLDTATNTWAASSLIKCAGSSISVSSGTKSLSGVLDRLRVSTVGGAATFTAGKINIQYQ